MKNVKSIKDVKDVKSVKGEDGKGICPELKGLCCLIGEQL